MEDGVQFTSDPLDIFMSALTEDQRREFNDLDLVIKAKAGEIGQDTLRRSIRVAIAAGAAYAIQKPSEVIVAATVTE